MSSQAAAIWIPQQWAERFAAAYEAMAGEPLRVEPGAPGPDAAAGDNSHHWRQSFDIGPGTAVDVVMPAEGWSAFGRSVLAGAGIDDASDDDARSTYLELLQQSLSGLASAMTSRLGREVNCGPGEVASSAPAALPTWFLLSTQAGPPVPAAVFVSGQLAAAIDQPRAQQSGSPASSGQGAAGGELAAPSKTAAVNASGQPIDLLYDVELPVSVSFGRAHLPLKEVLRLTSGSIVELNRGVGEPVELIVNNCVVARGEVVVVEGNYGVRVLQVISRSERLRTLH